jgi:hypothetical protein
MFRPCRAGWHHDVEVEAVGEILTAAGQLAHASEFRFDYWHTKAEHSFYTVRRGTHDYVDRWAICIGNGFAGHWDGTEWSDALRGPDAYKYELDEALVIAKRLAYEENQRWVAIFEAQRPGTIRGGPYDMATQKDGWDRD